MVSSMGSLLMVDNKSRRAPLSCARQEAKLRAHIRGHSSRGTRERALRLSVWLAAGKMGLAQPIRA
jgi:hypothetical protein